MFFEATSCWTVVKLEIMLEEFGASKSCCCCSALYQIGMPSQDDCPFLWLSITAVNGAISREETNFLKLHLNFNIFLNLVLFSSDPLAQKYAYLIGSVHNQMTFFVSLGWHPLKMNRRT